MASVRQIANCIGLPGNISILYDFYGLVYGAPKSLSLLQQIKLLKGKHIHLNLIRTGSVFYPLTIDAALQFMRDTYAAVNLGVGRVLHFELPDEEAKIKYAVIDGSSEFWDLCSEYSVANDGIDIFLANSVVGSSAGMSFVDGACDKGGKESGCVVALLEGPPLGVFLAHEVGHYLGLDHVDYEKNLMRAEADTNNVLTGNQGNKMREHCFVRPGCS